MGGIPLVARKIGMGRKSAIPEQYRDELSQELIGMNIRRELMLSCALIVIVVIILSLEMFSLDTQVESLYVSIASYRIHILLLLGSLAFIIVTSGYRRAVEKNIFILRFAHISINSFVLVFCSIIAVNNELAGQRPFSYLTAMLCIGSVVLMPAFERISVYSLSWIIYQVGMFLWVRDPMTIFQNFIFVTLLMVLSLLISKINYSAYVSCFLNKKALEEKSRELDHLYKSTEKNLMKRTEELNNKLEMEKIRTAFFANISHELRTPLNIIFSAEQMLECTLRNMEHQTKEKEIEQYMRIMKHNCYRLIRLITNLIDMTKIDAGYLLLNPKSCDIIKIVEDITLSVADYIEEKNINLIFDTDTEEKVILCDPDKVERIILNLLSNAVKFTPEGGHIYVNIFIENDKIILSVKDNGIGIPSEMSELIFERFVQVDKTYTRDREGSGVGLSLVKSLVEMHGGGISVKSVLGEGSEFIVSIPAVQPSYEINCPEHEALSENKKLEKVRIEFSDIYD